MKRHFSFGFKALAACAMSAMLAVSCYDDSKLWEEIEGLEERVAALEDKLNTEVATLNSKIGAVETAYKAADAALLEAVEGLTEELDALDGTVDGYIKSNDEALKAAIDELKKADAALAAVDTDVLLSLAKLGVVSVEKDKDGKVVITFVDESTLEIANEAGVVTIVDGKWAVVVDGEVTVLDALVHPDTTLDFRVGDDNTLYVSYDGKKTWESTGVVVNDETTFNVVEGYDYDEEAGTLTLTIAGEDYVLPIYQPDNSDLTFGRTKVFFNYGATKSIELNAEGIDEYYVMNKPDGWKVALEGTTLTVTAPVKDLIEMGAADLNGNVLVHATTAVGTCKVAKLDVTTGEALTLSYKDGNVNIFSAMTQETPSYYPGEPPMVDYVSLAYGILTVADYLEYASFEDFIGSYPDASGDLHSVLRNMLQQDYPAYVEGENEELNVSVPFAEIVTSTWDDDSYLEFDKDEVYVMWVAPEYGWDGPAYDEAQFVITGNYVEVESTDPTYNDVVFDAKMVGADGYIIGGTDKAQFDEWMKEDPDLTYEQALRDYLYGSWQPGPFAQFTDGDKTAMGEMYPAGIQTIKVSDVILKANGGGIMPMPMPGEGSTELDPDSEYFVWILPYYEDKASYEYKYTDLIFVEDCKTDPLQENESAKAEITIAENSITYKSVTYSIVPPTDGSVYYEFMTAEEWAEYFVGAEVDDAAVYDNFKWGYPYEERVDETNSYGIEAGTDYVLVTYAMANGYYWISTEKFTTPTVAEYVASLEDGATWTLTDWELTITEPIVIDKKLTIDLDGCTIIAEGVSAFNITTKGNLTIGNGKVTTDKNVFHNEGTLTINSGTYTTTGETMAAVYCDGPRLPNGGATDFAWHLTINGGTFVSEKFTCISLQNNYWNLNPEGSAALNAGTFTAAEDWYGLFVDCAKVNVDFAECTFTNTRIYVGTTPSCSTFINENEYESDKLLMHTPDKQQWLFVSEFMDEMVEGENSSFCFDFGVAWADLPIESLAGATVLAVDYGTVPMMKEQGAPEGSWFPAFPAYGPSEFIPTDFESGVISYLGMEIPYSDYDGENCTFDLSELFGEDASTVMVECTRAKEFIRVQAQ